MPEREEVPWGHVQVQQFAHTDDGMLMDDYSIAFPYSNQRDMCWLVAQLIGYVGDAGLDMDTIHISQFVSNLLIEAVGEDYEPYILPHGELNDESLQLVGHAAGGITLMYGNEKWDPNLFFVKFKQCGCNTCGDTGKWESTIEEAPTVLVDLGPCPDCESDGEA